MTKLSPEVIQARKALHVGLTEAFAQEFSSRFARRYAHQGAKDGAAIKRFIASMEGNVSIEEMREKLGFMWSDANRDPFTREHVTTISVFLMNWNRISMQQARHQGKHGGAKW